MTRYSFDETYYPPVSFYFAVYFSDISAVTDNSFQEVQGLSSEVELESIKEGGENRFTHRVPGRAKYPNLVLKRGLITFGSILATWCEECLSGEYTTPIEPKTLTVMLMDEYQIPLRTWNIVNAYPVKWQVSDFNAMESKLAIETIELAYNYFTIV